MSYPKYPADLLKRRANQTVLATRLRWPEGALGECWKLENRHPGWHVSWMHENVTPGWERPAGFFASHPSGAHVVKKIEAFAETAEELEPLLIEVPEHEYSVHGCTWCLTRL